MGKLEVGSVVRGERHLTVRPDWIGHSCARGTYRLLFGTTRAAVPPQTEEGSVLWEPVQECEIVLDDEMFDRLRQLLTELDSWYAQERESADQPAEVEPLEE